MILIPNVSVFSKAWSDYLNFYNEIFAAYADYYSTTYNILSEQRSFVDIKELETKIISTSRNLFESRFRSDDFLKSLFDISQSSSRLSKATGFGGAYQYISELAAASNNFFFEQVRDKVFRTPSHKVRGEGDFSLFHYDSHLQSNTAKKEPLLVVYAFINRHYILDLLPSVSIIRSLMHQGLDVYATDWGTPGTSSKNLTIEHFENHLDQSVNDILEHSGEEKLSLLGYCWGGDLALMYASLHPDKVKKVVTLAAPEDFSLDNGLLATWTRNIDIDAILDAYGNVPSMLLNSAFTLRSPIDFLHKYPHFFERQRDWQSIMQFFATEMWLYDSPPVIGGIYRQFVNDCYKHNLFIQNKMKIGDNQLIDLARIKAPFLNVIASNDDLVAPESSRALNDALGSKDKTILEFKSGHVGACISPQAHTELWPRVGEWLQN